MSKNCTSVSPLPTWTHILRMTRRRSAADVVRVVETFDLWMARVQQRRDLLALNDRMLRDVGVNRAEASAEAEKPFWRS
jgi:uncharacterized protein YjiS (DUF1127 family)